MIETIPDQLESCRYDDCVQKQLKFGMIKGISFFTLKWPLKVQPQLAVVHKKVLFIFYLIALRA